MAAFAQFSSDLDTATKRQLDRGERLVEVMKQGQFAPLPVERQIVIIYAATSGNLDALPVSAAQRFEKELNAFLDAKHSALLTDLRTKKELSDDLKSRINAALAEFAKIFKV
jgi:F-type H+-transporting ATPase subunit alpha